MTRDVEHLSMYLQPLCMSSLKKYLFRSFAHFKLDYLGFYTNLFYILDIHSFLDTWIANIVSYCIVPLLCRGSSMINSHPFAFVALLLLSNPDHYDQDQFKELTPFLQEFDGFRSYIQVNPVQNISVCGIRVSRFFFFFGILNLDMIDIIFCLFHGYKTTIKYLYTLLVDHSKSGLHLLYMQLYFSFDQNL